MKIIQKLMIVLLLLNTCQQLFANNYFVSPVGNDETGDGSIDAPFVSIEKACDFVGAGDTIFMRGGVYNFQQLVNSESNGTNANPIVICNYLNEEPIIDGSEVNLNNNSALLFVARWTQDPVMQHYVVQGITVRNSSERGISYYKTENLTIRDCKVYNIQKRGIGGYGSNVFIENNEIFQAALINENGIMGNSGWPMIIYGAVDYENGNPSENIFIRNNYVHECWGEGIGPGQGSTGVIIENNTVKDVWSVGIYCDKTSDVTISSNHIFNVNENFYRNGEPAIGISLANEISFHGMYPFVQNIRIYNNLISNVRKGIGFWLDASNNEDQNTYSGIDIAFNVIYNPTSAAIVFDDIPEGNTNPSGCSLHNNIFYSGAWSSEIMDVSAWNISHNNWVGEAPSFAGNYHITEDPALVAPAIDAEPIDFMLQANSPAIESGVFLPQIDTDFWGHMRMNPPCIGFHEFGASSEIEPYESNNFPIALLQRGQELQISVESEFQLLKFFVYDMQGRPVFAKEMKNNVMILNVQHLSKAYYIFWFLIDGERLSTKFLIK